MHTFEVEIIPETFDCPKCFGTDYYFAKRQVGQIGALLDLPNVDSSSGFTRSVEKDVAICRNCGERMNHTPQKAVLNKKENIRGTLMLLAFVVSLGFLIYSLFFM